ncbi:MAG: bifunctional (p)ppGpp synthetase/guanosine-3',5'-bis(diphosphate) 3'-pyrophosphohydrolase, partial [Selenomonadales bacterium]|nr:bifunctional (p)ppGpp synthetase/guanosine-3',5'-bis(diphosphate) 3'-pyrophosphohydrolase [Selenomonadales bacterium]
LGTIHAIWKPIPKRFKDYIAVPKSNMYQSLHTTVIDFHGQPLEIQIRTYDMHRVSEYGIAAHWKYKEGGKGGSKGLEEKMSWLRQLIEWQKEIRDPKEFVEAVKLDVFADEVFVFTPRGDVVALPAGSIPLDFAYRIHTDVGHRCAGAKVNGKIVPLEYRLVNGDIVEIITNKQSAGPSRDWLNIVGASETRNKIRSWFKKERREENIIKGKELLEKESKKLGYEFKTLTKNDRLTKVAQKLAAGTADDVLATVGFGGMTAKGIISKLLEIYKKEVAAQTPPDVSQMLASLKPSNTKASKSSHGVLVEGEAGFMVRLAKCCNPIPGDMIVGYITRGRGVSVHRADCPNIKLDTNEYERMVDVGWDIMTDTLYKVTVEINCGNRAGLMAEVMMVPSEMKINITSINARTHKNNTATIVLEIEISNNMQIETIMTKLRRLKDVYSVYRAIPSQKG